VAISGLAVVLAATLGITGCSSGAQPANEKVVLKVAGTSDTQAFEKILLDYTKSHPNVTIQSTFVPTDQYTTTTRTQLGANNGADVFLVFPGSGNTMSVGPLAKAGAISDLSDQPWVAREKKSWASGVQYDGKTYIYPLGAQALGVIYDTALFAKNHITVPTTWTEFLASCDSFNKIGIAPISVGMQTSYVPQFISYALVPSTVYIPDPTFDSDHLAGKTSFAATGWKETLTKYVDLQKAGCFNKGFNGTTYDQMLNDVATNKAAMTITVSPSFPAIRKANPTGKFAMFPLPAFDTPAQNGAPEAITVGFAVNAKSKHLAAAKELVAWINQAGNTPKFAEALGAASVEAGAKVPEGLDAIVAKWDKGLVGPFPDSSWPGPEVQTTHGVVIQQLFTGQTTVDGALKQMDVAFNAYLKK
jgi:raffinose/stachyose/melibiose transport system substrate-binding protein